MKPRMPALVFAAALALIGPLAQSGDQLTPEDLAPVTATQAIEVAGVQTSADDARQLGEADPFIINDGFGD